MAMTFTVRLNITITDTMINHIQTTRTKYKFSSYI